MLNEVKEREDVGKIKELQELEKNSLCTRAKVGAILVPFFHRPGYFKYQYEGWNRYDEICTPENGCYETGCINTFHAELDVITQAASEGVSTHRAVLFCSYTPCLPCAKLIIASKIRAFLYYKEYRDTSGLNLLLKHEIEVVKLV